MNADSLQNLASQIDQATECGDTEMLQQSLEFIESALDACEPYASVHLNFYAANCYAGLRSIRTDHEQAQWRDSLLEDEIKHLRSALEFSEKGIERLPSTDLPLRIETNLANGLNSIGRFVEALEHFDHVIAKAPSFGMAIGNRAHCVSWYARYLSDTGHQAIFLNESRIGLRRALEIGVEEHAVKDMSQWLAHLESLADWEQFSPDIHVEVPAESSEEREYRLWCIENRLFLNPLNDLFSTGIVANDALSFPSVVVSVAESSPSPPEVFGIFNQLKQEIVSARYILFQAIQESQRDSLHFADKKVKLVDMLDYRHYRLWVEMAKMAFLHAYAIFDKIGYLINDYWRLGRPVINPA